MLIFVGHRLVIRIEHWDQSGIRGTLHVVLSPKWMQPGAFATHVTGDQRHRNQAARIVGSVRVLRDAHSPEYDRAGRFCISSGDLTQRFRIDPADCGHLLG